MIIQNKVLDEERALYGLDCITVIDCKFDGPADGESALKECKNVKVENTFFNLRYPFWHNHSLEIYNSELTEFCRAAIWYTENGTLSNSKLHGIKMLRECKNIVINNCSIISEEFGWFCNNIDLNNCNMTGAYVFLRGENLSFQNTVLIGKYSFQYITNSVFDGCNFDTKDAFWHAKNITVRNSTLKGEYLGWYSENLTLENCHIIGTQPLCYCKNLKLINCTMEQCDLAFEKSSVDATVNSHILSVKNPLSGRVKARSVGEIIIDDKDAKAVVITE